MIAPINGRWWLDEGQDSGVWPCEVVACNTSGVRVKPTLGPHSGEESWVDHSRVYDSGFNRVREAT